MSRSAEDVERSRIARGPASAARRRRLSRWPRRQCGPCRWGGVVTNTRDGFGTTYAPAR